MCGLKQVARMAGHMMLTFVAVFVNLDAIRFVLQYLDLVLMLVVPVPDALNKYLVNIDVRLTNRYDKSKENILPINFKDFKYDYTSYSSDDYYGDLGDILSFL